MTSSRARSSSRRRAPSADREPTARTTWAEPRHLDPAGRPAGSLTARERPANMAEDWDAATYDRIADPMARWGTAVLDRLPLRGDERVLDAGCGSGRVTERLLASLPLGHVIALDASPAMIEEARRRLAPFAYRVTYVVANLLDPLPIDPPVDAILSTATFHWVPDHSSPPQRRPPIACAWLATTASRPGSMQNRRGSSPGSRSRRSWRRSSSASISPGCPSRSGPASSARWPAASRAARSTT